MKEKEKMPRLHSTKNDLSEKARTEMIGLLNAHLADGTDLALQAKQAHWNVKGPRFFPLHELFDKLYAEATEWNDLVAERAAQLGGVAEGTLQAAIENTRLSPYGLEIVNGRDHLEALSDSLAAYGKSVRQAIDTAAGAGDADTADLFTEISRDADKMLWFLEAHLQAEK
ncbi:MAG: DNA starvation/stationary phase protection protein Dps [Vicinamibacteria bacterium]